MDMYERAINDTLLSGIAPLSLRYKSVFDGYGECPSAYRASTVLFTTTTGIVEKAIDKVTDDELGAVLTLCSVAHAIRAMEALWDRERNVRWIAVEASVSLLLAEDAYDKLKLEINRLRVTILKSCVVIIGK